MAQIQLNVSDLAEPMQDISGSESDASSNADQHSINDEQGM